MEDRETLAFGFVEDVFVIIHQADKVDEEDWRLCVQTGHRARSLSRMLIVPGHTLPDVVQRHDIVALHEKHGMHVALLSDSGATLRVTTALRWAGIKAESFIVDDLDGMLVFLERPQFRARMSSALGPYLDRSWLHVANAVLIETPAPHHPMADTNHG